VVSILIGVLKINIMQQLKNKSEKRKEEILEAALKCFNKKGYYRTSIDEIAHKTGLTKGAVYYYFKSKKKHRFFIKRKRFFLLML